MNLKETIRKVLLESELPSFVKRRLTYNEEDILNYLKKFSIRLFEPNKKIESIIKKVCVNTAYELISNMTLNIDDTGYYELEDKVTKFLISKYGELIKDYITKFYDSSGDEVGNDYYFWKHADRYGGNGFSESFETWNMLLRKYADWFPDLDWAEIKTKLDDNGKLLIKKPGDKNNIYNYYFSLIKK